MKTKKPHDASPDTMERLQKAFVNPEVPNSGYVKEARAATDRGREQMAAGRRGERNFPPARQVVKP